MFCVYIIFMYIQGVDMLSKKKMTKKKEWNMYIRCPPRRFFYGIEHKFKCQCQDKWS